MTQTCVAKHILMSANAGPVQKCFEVNACKVFGFCRIMHTLGYNNFHFTNGKIFTILTFYYKIKIVSSNAKRPLFTKQIVKQRFGRVNFYSILRFGHHQKLWKLTDGVITFFISRLAINRSILKLSYQTTHIKLVLSGPIYIGFLYGVAILSLLY